MGLVKSSRQENDEIVKRMDGGWINSASARRVTLYILYDDLSTDLVRLKHWYYCNEVGRN